MSKKKNSKVKKYSKFDTAFYYMIIFLIGSFVGYLYEIIFYYIDENHFINRGFLYGPYLPVYGFGAIIMLLTIKRFKKNPLVIFILAMLLTGITEYVAGFLVYQVYHEMWWDYTGLLLNINGYVCLRSVLTFAIGALLLFYLIDPFVESKVMNIKDKNKKIIFWLLVAIFVIDIVFTMLYRHPL